MESAQTPPLSTCWEAFGRAEESTSRDTRGLSELLGREKSRPLKSLLFLEEHSFVWVGLPMETKKASFWTRTQNSNDSDALQLALHPTRLDFLGDEASADAEFVIDGTHPGQQEVQIRMRGNRFNELWLVSGSPSKHNVHSRPP